MSFWKAFFKQNFEDGLGQGSFGSYHFIWIAVSIILFVSLYQYFKRHPTYARTFLVVTSVIMFVFRLCNQTYRALAGYEVPPLEAIPWHLCTVMSFVLPIVVVFNIKKLKPSIYTLCLIGGIVTIAMGEFFDNSVITIFNLEGMWVHMLLILTPLIEMATGEFRLEFKNWWHTVLGLVIVEGWAALADWVFFKDYDPNFSLLKKNELPFAIPGLPFQFTYITIGIVFVVAMYGIPTLYRAWKHKNQVTDVERNQVANF